MKSEAKSLADLVSTVEKELESEFETRLRAALEAKDRTWLLEALVQQALQERNLQAVPHRSLSRVAQHVEPLAERRQRLDRIRGLRLNSDSLRKTLERYRSLDRERLVAEGYLVDPPHKGKEALSPQQRTSKGESLLRNAHDLFYALLFCDHKQGVNFVRSRKDFLTVTLPSSKSDTLERFMLAVTETHASGTWLDPEGVSDDIAAPNTILQVEYGDSSDGLISEALLAVLKMINNLEVNEEILYARIERLERSTLVQ